MATSFPGCGITAVDTCSTMGVACPLRFIDLVHLRFVGNPGWLKRDSQGQ